MKLEPVKSSAIEAVGYDAPTKELHVRFHGGGTHVYTGVSAESHASLIGAKSIGKHFAKHIRSRHRSKAAK